MKPYKAQSIEKKWQKYWEEHGTYRQYDRPKKQYILDMFPYPSGAGLHVGHPKGYIASDVYARFKQLEGYGVLHPMGWDAFGLPAENYAIKAGIHPEISTKKNIKRFTQQIKSLGLSYDWARELSTCDPEYYKWTQWLFLLLYKNGLAYKKEANVNWCPKDNTVLANEQVINGKCDRCGSEVVEKQLAQWFFKITKYAERLLNDIEKLDWPEPIKAMQRNWIGKSEGVLWNLKVKDHNISVQAFDSVPQTFMAQTFAVVAPEHPMVAELVRGTQYAKPVLNFVEKIKKRKVANKFSLDKDIDGVFTGAVLDNPFGTGDLPIWVASFVVMDYGTGFVTCSAHDERDFAFAKKFGIPLRPVMFPANKDEARKVRNLEYCYHHDPEAIMEQAPKNIVGMKWGEAREPIIDYVEKQKLGKRTVQYKLRDWLISRQRYWGAPIPIIYCDTCGEQPVPEKDLPVKLPKDVDFRPTGESPLVRSKSFHKVNCPKCGAKARRDSDTMDTFVDSSWYFLRYTDPKNKKAFADKKRMESWLPVDLYVGGAEHAVLHLLYARFFTKVLCDLKFVNFQEPFTKLKNQGLILGPDGEKMSKSRGNVINPDDVVAELGADSLRLYEMFMGPLEDAKPWSTQGIVGVRRFLDRVWVWVHEVKSEPNFAKATSGKKLKVKRDSEVVERAINKLIKKVTEDIENFRFNTCISSMMEFLNTVKTEPVSKDTLIAFLSLLYPFAPHITEELYEALGGKKSLQLQKWPTFNPKKVVESMVEIVVQVNGKLREKVSLPAGRSQAEVIAEVMKLEKVKAALTTTPKRTIFVPNRLVNFVL